MNEHEEIERLKAARYEARKLGYLLFVDDALNIEPLKYQAWAGPATFGQATMGRFLAYGESLGGTAEAGLATLSATLGEDEDSQRVRDIIRWFDGLGMELWLHEIGGKWSAVVMSYASNVGAGLYGRGNTAREAAEDAQRSHEARTTKGSADTVMEPPAADAQAQAPPPTVVISGEGVVSGEEEIQRLDLGATDLTEVAQRLAGLAPDFVWLAAFVREPTGEYRAHLLDSKTADVIKTASGNDFHDAVLELFKETFPPSDEVRNQ